MTSETNQSLHLTPEDLDIALDLFSEHEQVGIGQLAWFLFVYILFAIVVVACPLGLLFVWFDTLLGGFLLILSLIFFILFFAFYSKVDTPVDKLTKLLGDTDLGHSLRASLEEQAENLNVLIGCLVVIPGAISLVVGAGLILYSLITTQTLNYLGVLLVVWPLLLLYIFVAFDEYRKLKYVYEVSELQVQLRQLKEQTVTEGKQDITVTSRQLDMLKRMETDKVERTIAQFQTGEFKQNWYSVAISPEVMKLIAAKDHQEARLIREAVDQLQLNPRPETAVVINAEKNHYAVKVNNYEVEYFVDDSRNRCDVVGIRQTAAEEDNDAS